jgi:hypothetical protein
LDRLTDITGIPDPFLSLDDINQMPLPRLRTGDHSSAARPSGGRISPVSISLITAAMERASVVSAMRMAETILVNGTGPAKCCTSRK